MLNEPDANYGHDQENYGQYNGELEQGLFQATSGSVARLGATEQPGARLPHLHKHYNYQNNRYQDLSDMKAQ